MLLCFGGIKMPGKIVDQPASLPKLNRTSLEKLWKDLFQTTPPRLRRDLLVRILAHRLQEQTFGGLTPDYHRRLQQLAATIQQNCQQGLNPRLTIKPGTRLVREWHSKTHIVQVAERGYEYNGSSYNSLSEIARLITGTRRSGPLFFGLRQKQTSSTTEVA